MLLLTEISPNLSQPGAGVRNEKRTPATIRDCLVVIGFSMGPTPRGKCEDDPIGAAASVPVNSRAASPVDALEADRSSGVLIQTPSAMVKRAAKANATVEWRDRPDDPVALVEVGGRSSSEGGMLEGKAFDVLAVSRPRSSGWSLPDIGAGAAGPPLT
jgi:hypothetical protein